MADDPPFNQRELPDEIRQARAATEATRPAYLAAIKPVLESSLSAGRHAIGQLEAHHAHVADATDLDLRPGASGRPIALWESCAAALGLARAMLELTTLGYHVQMIPTYRALHEMLGIVSVLADIHEDEFLDEWLADEEVRARKVREAMTRQADRVREEMRAAGVDDDIGDAGALMRELYGPMSDGSHGRRSAVRAYISAPLRSAATGPHPDADQWTIHHEFSLLLVEQVVMTVGDGLTMLYGGMFFRDVVKPLQATVVAAMAELAALAGPPGSG